jgi:hypothetical protein
VHQRFCDFDDSRPLLIALPSKVSDLSRRNRDYATMWQNSADRRIGSAFIRKLVQDPEQKLARP